MGGEGRRDGWKGGGGQKRKHPGDQGITRKHAFKVLCPEALINSLMGSRGSTKDQIQEETGCRLVFSNRDEYFPGTHYRTLGIYSDEPGAITAVLGKVIDSIIEWGDHELGGSKAMSEGDFTGKESGEYVLRALISGRMSGAVIGTKGTNIQAIRDENNARIFIEKNSCNGHQMMRVIAAPDGLRSALARINECVQTETDHEDFPQWAAVRSFSDEDGASRGKAKGKGKGKGSRKGAPAVGDRDQRHGQQQEWDGHGAQDGDGNEAWEEGWPETIGGEAANGDLPDVDQGALQALGATVQEFPSGTLDLEYSISCEMPGQKVPWLVGENNEYLESVREATGASVHFEEIQGSDGGQQLLLIQGHLLRVYRAHAMMMKRYHDADVEAKKAEQQPSVTDLQEQLAQLQRQLSMVQSQMGSSAGGKGKGKKG